MRLVTADDVNFDEALLNRRNDDSAPCGYIHIWEDSVFTMGIFVVRQGARIPLHDHPGMHGLLKVIHGCVTLTSFSPCDDSDAATSGKLHSAPLSPTPSPKPVRRLPTIQLDCHAPPCVLTPYEGNFHEVRTENGPAAFLDILHPPYDREIGGRQCRYYKEVSASGVTSEGWPADAAEAETVTLTTFLQEIPQPLEFWCDSAVYRGPDVDPYEDAVD